MSSAQRFIDGLSAELTRAFLWLPLCLALGILAYFAMPSEPPFGGLAGSAAIMAVAALSGLLSGYYLRPFLLALAVIAMGFLATGIRSVIVAGPVLEWRYYGPVEGRVIALDRSASGALRVTLDQVGLGRLPRTATPRRVRLSLYGPDAEKHPAPGSRIMTTAHLSPPSGPAEPHGFDFQRHAWFTQIGGVGYTRVPVLLAVPAPDRFSFFALRMALSVRIQRHLSGQTGAFAAALMTGDRSGLDQDTLRDLRQSNLAHLLAISGLHMGLLAGFVFAALRLALIFVPGLGDGRRARKLAALGALIAAAVYLGLSGASVATERAFIMAAVALGAVMLERRAISLRAVALAAMVILLKRPEALTGPGFQMSFAATTALVVVFTLLSGPLSRTRPNSKVLGLVMGTVISSAVAGMATLPIAAAHFNLIAHYGLIANLVSVPLMGVMVIPLAVVAVCLMPLGWEAPALQVMGFGLDWILDVAAHISSWPGAISKVPTPPRYALFALLLGLLLLGVAATRVRWLGLVPVLAALAAWGTVKRPAILISDNGVLVGVLTGEGRALSKESGSGFLANIWLQNDGSDLEQYQAFRLWGDVQTAIPGKRLIVATGKRGLSRFRECEEQDIAVFSEVFERDVPCEVFDQTRLRKTGSVAVSVEPNGDLKITTARAIAGRRYWNDRELRARILPDQ